MRSARSLGQALAAALQIVALLVFVMPGAVHAHPGAVRMQGHAHAMQAAAEHGAHHAAAPAMAVSDAGAAQGDPAHAACPDCSCGCHAAFAAIETAVSVRRQPASARPPVSDRALASLTPEALPEPPRPFA